MSETKWTPGPWSVDDGEVHHKGHFVITAKGMSPNTPLARIGGADWDDASKADAHLIAAAPDLYVALEEVVRLEDQVVNAHDKGAWLEWRKQWKDAMESARAALRKARGEA